MRFGYIFSNVARRGYFNLSRDHIYCILVILPIAILAIFIQIRMFRIYSKFKKIKNVEGVSGAVAARNILDSYGLQYVRVEMVEGTLSDHFDPMDNVVRLSRENYEGSSIASVGIAAHEVGHAIQHAKEYKPMKLRSAVITTSRFGSFLSMPLILIGMIFSLPKLAYLGVILFSLIVILQLATLFVEFDASSRAVKIISSQQILTQKEVFFVKKVLWAAAMTYVVSFLSALAELIRLILIVGSLGKNDED